MCPIAPICGRSQSNFFAALQGIKPALNVSALSFEFNLKSKIPGSHGLMGQKLFSTDGEKQVRHEVAHLWAAELYTDPALSYKT